MMMDITPEPKPRQLACHTCHRCHTSSPQHLLQQPSGYSACSSEFLSISTDDHSRVLLKAENSHSHSDYINASPIGALDESIGPAACGPQPQMEDGSHGRRTVATDGRRRPRTADGGHGWQTTATDGGQRPRMADSGQLLALPSLHSWGQSWEDTHIPEPACFPGTSQPTHEQIQL
ncbi:hypothetical protein P7K49_026060 [Saguinus oedipus]|uniref:Uncharacterized protein n=1 Tax=Saguinus oedipus TaxID=9490 RepID=A0ABQ9UJH7_SAGOE|nr:hypothetical protein P7K49_026060 [Saguinus oedipus]